MATLCIYPNNAGYYPYHLVETAALATFLAGISGNSSASPSGHRRLPLADDSGLCFECDRIPGWPTYYGALFYDWAENGAYMLQIADSNHHDLGAPAPTGRPIILELGLNPTQFPDGAYLARIVNEYILAFFDKHLKNKPTQLLDVPSPYPEVWFVRKDGN